MASMFTDKLNPPVDFAALAENCFSGAQLGLSGEQIAAQNDVIAGIDSKSLGRS